MSRVLRLAVILRGDVVSFGAQNVSFGMPVASALAPWGDRRAIQGHLGAQEGRPWSPGLDVCRFEGGRVQGWELVS